MFETARCHLLQTTVNRMGSGKVINHIIDLPGIGNARDLGGYAIGNRVVKPGVLLRAARLDQAQPEAIERLAREYRVQTVVDFRMTEERQSMPDPDIPGSDNIILPVTDMRDLMTANPAMLEMYGGSLEDALAASGRMMTLYTDPRTDRIAMFNQMCEYGLVSPDIYLSFLLGERGKQAYRAFFQALLQLEEGRAILWHCTDGKDRTGCAAMLALFALGASRETVLEDYLMTNAVNARKLSAIREKATSYHMEDEKLELLLFLSGGAVEGFMDRAIDALTLRYGSAENYIEQELGIGEAEREALRARFLTQTELD